MYKDNGKVNVELLAEVGDIAHRLRNLDERLALDLSDPRYLQQLQHYQGAANCSTECESKSEPESECAERRPSLAAKLAQDISDRLSASASTSDTAESASSLPSSQSQEESKSQPQQQQHQQTRRYSSKQVEDIILEFYEKHLIYHQTLESERLTNSSTAISSDEPKQSRIYRLTDADPYNMSNLSTSTDPGNCSSTNFSNLNSENVVQNLDSDCSPIDRASSIPNESTGSDLITAAASAAAAVTPTTSAPAGGKRNSFANQPMPEIQISNSDEQPKKHKSLSEQLPQNESKESTTIESSGEQQQPASSHELPLTTSTGGICGHYCAGWQSTSWSNQLDDNILLTLVMELKHKVEFTERMNWLCKYPFFM